MIGNVHDIITCAKFQIQIFMGYEFTGGLIFDFLIDFALILQQCSAHALPVMYILVKSLARYFCGRLHNL